MKYCALLSGGKDSCYNLLHCYHNGHHLVAAASLGPQHGKEELDSYMYQTVGQDAIEFVAQALDVPLYRRVISGAAVEQGSEYGARNPSGEGGVRGDETEDLYELLSTVKSQHPDIQGVSVGAILSNYQRVRVEHVCRRLSLTPLCYLWQRDQSDLLHEMIESGLEAILIKVAGIGLNTKHLGKTLSQMEPTLMKLNNLYGSHVCGEGGEYETLTLDCPLFKSRIHLVETEIVVHSDGGFATVAYLRIKKAELVSKSEADHRQAIIPPVLSEEFSIIRDVVLQSQASTENGCSLDYAIQSSYEPSVSSNLVGNWVAIANVQKAGGTLSPDLCVEDEVRDCFQTLQNRLQQYSLHLTNCANINIFISSIDLFARVNAVYASYFGTSPPARACVAVDLPPGIRVRLDCIAYAESSLADRQALHVQGLSYWAPANIGPYSQAITVDQRIFISGQIGLVPSNLSLPSPRSLAVETALSFQHVDRIVTALKNNSGGGWDGHTQGSLYWLVNSRDIIHVRRACEAFEKNIPTLFLVISALPKDALVEKQVFMHTGQSLVEEDDDIVRRSVTPVFEQGDLTGSAHVHWEISRFTETTSATAIICVRGEDHNILSQIQDIPELKPIWPRILSVRLFHRSLNPSFSAICDALFLDRPLTSIPCRTVSTMNGQDWDYAIFMMCN